MIDDVLYAYSYAVAVVHGKQRTMTSGHDGEMAEDDGVNGRMIESDLEFWRN